MTRYTSRNRHSQVLIQASKPSGRKLAGQCAVVGRQELHVMKLVPIARGPRHERQKEPGSHQRDGTDQLFPVGEAPPLREQHQTHRKQEKRCFRAHQSSKSDDEPAKKPLAEARSFSP